MSGIVDIAPQQTVYGPAAARRVVRVLAEALGVPPGS